MRSRFPSDSVPSGSLRGVVDLAALKQPAPARPAAQQQDGAAPATTAAVIDVDEAGFQTEVLERSVTVPVVLDLWADWCEPCKQLSPILERIATEYGGRFVLAKVDTDANQRLAMALGVQGIPAVKAIIGGQLVGEFTGAQPEAQVRQWIEDLLRVAVEEFGLAAAAGGPEDAAVAAPAKPVDPAFDAAADALEAGDVDGAARAFRNVLESDPGNADAKSGLAQAELVRRARDLDPAKATETANAKPDDVEAQLAAADADLYRGETESAITRLVETVRVTAGADRDAARLRLLEYFDLLGPEDPRVAKGRSALSSVLF